jgi:endothelin-converting enzyme
LKAAYDACMDEDAIKKEGVGPLLEIIMQVADRFLTGKSVITQEASLTSADTDEMAEAILYLAKLGVSALISSGASADDTDPDTVVVQVSSPYRIGLPAKDYYKDDNVVKKYEEALSQVLSSLFPDLPHASGHEVVEFEKKLAAASPDAKDQQDVTVCAY